MNKEKKAFQFDDLINDFFAALETGDESRVLENFIRDFPEFEIDFIEAAAYKRTVSEMPEREYSKEEEEKLTLRTQSVVQNILYKYRRGDSTAQPEAAKVDDAAPIVSLFGEIERKGFTVKTFAPVARLSETVIEAFNTREVKYGSIARQAIKNVALALGRSAQDVGNYLSQTANPQPMHARADESPRFSSQMDFFELIATDPDLSEEDKQYWLGQKPQENE